MNIRFHCPACEIPGRVQVPGPSEWQCPHCDHRIHLPRTSVDPMVPICVLCGNTELYKKKDFPHALGMGILVAACLGSTVSYALYNKVWTWAILLGSAAFDGLLYLWVKDAVVCYRCQAHYCGIPANSAHSPFELTIHERYRQERLRHEQLQAEGKQD